MLPTLLSDEDGERGPRSIALFWSEDPPSRMLRIDQFGTCTHPRPVEWLLDEGEQERKEVQARRLRIGPRFRNGNPFPVR